MGVLPLLSIAFGIVVVAVGGTLNLMAAIAMLAALCCANLLALRRSAALRHGIEGRTELAAETLAVCWLVITILPLHSFINRTTTTAASEVGIQPVIELAYMVAIAGFAVTVVGRAEPGLPLARPPMLLFTLPVWTIASSTWSPYGPYAFARGVQLAVFAVLAWATLSVARTNEGFLDVLFRVFFRWLVRIAVALVGLGVLFGPILVPAGSQNAGRFTWIGAHPNASGLVLTAALVVAVTAPVDLLRLRVGARAAVVVVLTVALYANHSRMSWLELVVGAVVAFLLAGRHRPLLRSVGTPLLAMAGIAAVLFWGEQIGDYLLRNDDTGQLSTGNGRLALWPIGFDALETPFDWVFGLGYGVTRTVFLVEGPWAVNAHNSVLAWLVNGGLIAVVLFLSIVMLTVRNLLAARVIATRRDGLAMVGLLAVICLNGLASDAMAEPTMGIGVLYLFAAVSMALVELRRGDVSAHHSTVSS